jgi:probable rRNA maturation factor
VAIEVINRQRLIEIDRRIVADLAQATLEQVAKVKGEPHTGIQLSVAFVRDKKIQQLNRLYRGKNYATDVLSFPATAEQNDPDDIAEENYLGDIVIATDTARRQATEASLSVEREIQELVIHGVLHLCGYDHETDNGEMNRLEVKLRRQLLR